MKIKKNRSKGKGREKIKRKFNIPVMGEGDEGYTTSGVREEPDHQYRVHPTMDT